MYKIISFVNKHKVTVIIFFIIIGIIIYISLKRETVAPISQERASWNNLVPGLSTRSEVIEKLGQPIEEVGNTASFNSISPTRTHKAIFEDNTTSILKEIVASEDTKQ